MKNRFNIQLGAATSVIAKHLLLSPSQSLAAATEFLDELNILHMERGNDGALPIEAEETIEFLWHERPESAMWQGSPAIFGQNFLKGLQSDMGNLFVGFAAE